MATSRRRVSGAVAVCVLVVALVACRGADVSAGPMDAAKVEAIGREHLPEPDRVGRVTFERGDAEGSVGARFEYGDTSVDLVVGPPPGSDMAAACRGNQEDDSEGCSDLGTDVDGATLLLLWQEEQPEEDPGTIVLLMERPGEVSSVRWGGDVVVVGDPRDMDLAVPVDDAVDLLEDDQLRLEVP